MLMPESIIIAMGSVVAGGFIGYFINYFVSRQSTNEIKDIIISNRSYYNISEERRVAINGVWKGFFSQEKGPGGIPLDLDLEATLTVKPDGPVIGVISYTYNSDKTLLDVRGNAMDNKYVVLAYADRKRDVIRYGTIMLELSSLGNELNGKFLAHAAEMEGIVPGEMTLVKL